jgi:hypothetical protein
VLVQKPDCGKETEFLSAIKPKLLDFGDRDVQEFFIATEKLPAASDRSTPFKPDWAVRP